MPKRYKCQKVEQWKADLFQLAADFQILAESKPIINSVASYEEGWRKIMDVYDNVYAIRKCSGSFNGKACSKKTGAKFTPIYC